MGRSETLMKARETYGNKNQILVCIEELNELACVLAKFPRYDDESVARVELHDKVLDEVADVYIILDHVINIMDLKDVEIIERRDKKIKRLQRWLDNSSSMQQTIDDRAILDNSCENCINQNTDKEDGVCNCCMVAEAVEGIRPFYDDGK